MTIAIAAICDADNSTQTANIIVCTDTRIAWGLSTSNEGGSKLYDLPHGLFMSIGDSVSRCNQFNGYLHAALTNFQTSHPSFVELVRLAIDKANEECMLWARRETLSDFGISLDEFLSRKDLNDRDAVLAAIRDSVAEIDVIVSGFAPNGSPLMFHTDGSRICECMVPGFACAGSGANVALDWLNFRGQNGNFSTQRTYYHVREAHSHAGLSIGVGDTCHMLLLRHKCDPVDIGRLTPSLQEWVNAFYPRKTDCLESQKFRDQFATEYGLSLAPMPSTSQKSED